MRLLTLGILLLFAPGCVSVSIARHTMGTGDRVRRAEEFKAGAAMEAVLAELGSPDLMVPAEPVNRVYYSSGDSRLRRVIVSIWLPWGFGAGGTSIQVFISTRGRHTLDIARLDFSPDRRLVRDVEVASVPLRGEGYYMGIHSLIVDAFLEDKARAAALEQVPHIERERPPDEDGFRKRAIKPPPARLRELLPFRKQEDL
jgi:hypothetical protein